MKLSSHGRQSNGMDDQQCGCVGTVRVCLCSRFLRTYCASFCGPWPFRLKLFFVSHVSLHVCSASSAVMAAPISWAERRKASGQARGSSTKLLKEERLLKQVSQAQGVVAGLSDSSLTDWCSATGQSLAIPQMMSKEERLRRPKRQNCSSNG